MMGLASIEQLGLGSGQTVMDEYIVQDDRGRPLSLEDLPGVRMARGAPAPPVLMRVVHRHSGRVVWHLLKSTALRDSDGDFAGAMTVISDVTAVKDAELRMRVLAQSATILASSLDYQRTLRNVAAVAVPSLADYCGVDVVDEHGRLERVATEHNDPAKQDLARRLGAIGADVPAGANPSGHVLATGNSALWSEVTDEELAPMARGDEHLQMLHELELRSVLMVPLRTGARTIGLMTLATADSRRTLTREDLELAEQLGQHAAIAVENSRLHTKLATIAEALQQNLRPAALPEIPGWELASLYRPAQTEQRIDVGGDFYEFVERGEHWFAIVGDVTGKGVSAASMTALMRHGARFASHNEFSPAGILAQLDAALKQQPGAPLCTALCLRLHEDHVVISSAGHPAAVLAGKDGALRQAPTPGPLLGAFVDARWDEETVSVAPGETLVLYTDGVTETRGVDDRFGAVRLRELLARHAAGGPQELLARLNAALQDFRVGAGDDIAALALRARPAR